MITIVPDMLSTQEVDRLRAGLALLPHVDGAKTAGGAAREVKKNQQVPSGTRKYEQLADIVNQAFVRNETLQGALLPASATRVVFNRYGEGMQYGPHIDRPMMGILGNQLRTDIAITVFLSDPDTYTGGELTVVAGGRTQHKFKEKAGAAVAYPANSLHHVTPVGSGAREAAVLWVQSLVRDPAKREILWDLELAERDLYKRDGRSESFEAVNRSHSNLMRMWVEI